MNFADRSILLSDVNNLNCFSIAACGGTHMYRVMSWIYIAMKHNAKDLDIYSEQKEPVKLPPRVFHLHSLKRLSLTVFHNQTLHWPRTQALVATLVALEELTLCGFRFVDTERDAISLSCPDLRSWKMERCTGPSLATITISDTFMNAKAATSFEILASKLCKFVWLDKLVDRYKSSKMSPLRTDLRLKWLWGISLLISLNETRRLTIDCISVWICFSSSFIS
ncbi:uncharacterized protein A4U43_C04F21540 [Asparagus officinalis]|uniref:F-box/LRR-repeat protein 15/At3g58940/PEG3-like LRR domain-containing protein n=1 Tax=Asparagus officinalis TaxID=4686 RepID=A0A5P1F3B6_ASPOF|nr:uncharacterized protein A4U43_C04F21540 [Asparagus officinalis]